MSMLQNDVSTQIDMSRGRAIIGRLANQPKPESEAQIQAKVAASRTTGLTWEGDSIRGPDLEDVAILSSTLSGIPETTSPVSIFRALLPGLNKEEAAAAYIEAHSASKSHNLMLERFMQGTKASALMVKLVLSGATAQEIDAIQSQTRDLKLSEIHTKLKDDWAHGMALNEILGSVA
jgi:hypothetical protein